MKEFEDFKDLKKLNDSNDFIDWIKLHLHVQFCKSRPQKEKRREKNNKHWHKFQPEKKKNQSTERKFKKKEEKNFWNLKKEIFFF